MCKVLGVSRSGYYNWLTRPKSNRTIFHEKIDAKIQAIYAVNGGKYGYPRIYQDSAALNFKCSKMLWQKG